MFDFPEGYTVYLAAAMRDQPLYNFPALHDAARRLRNMGLTVISPAELDVASGVAVLQYDDSAYPQLVSVTMTEKFDIDQVLAQDLEAIRGVDEIILLPGWRSSHGVAVEMQEAMKHVIPVSYARAWDGGISGSPHTGTPNLPGAEQVAEYVTWWARCPRPRTLRWGATRPTHDRRALTSDGTLEVSGKEPMSSGEKRLTDPITGGQKGMKPERMELIPPEAMAEMARVYAHGAEKYAAFNWLKGYPWSWSVGALARHLNRYQAGERRDMDSGRHHLAHVMFHCATLMEFERLGRGTDDLPWGKDLDIFLATLPKD